MGRFNWQLYNFKKYDKERKDATYEVLREFGVLGLASEEMTDEGRLIAIKAVDIAISYINQMKGKILQII